MSWWGVALLLFVLVAGTVLALGFAGVFDSDPPPANDYTRFCAPDQDPVADNCTEPVARVLRREREAAARARRRQLRRPVKFSE